MSLPEWSLALDNDESAVLEAALGMLDGEYYDGDTIESALLEPVKLQCNLVDGASVSSRHLVRGDSKEMEVVDAFLDEFSMIEELNEQVPQATATTSPSSDTDSSSPSGSVPRQVKERRRSRVRPKQELNQLREQEIELSRKLKALRLESRQRVLDESSLPREGSTKAHTRKHSLMFWERVALRQDQQRQRAEQENRRLKDQLQMYARHSRLLQQALNRRLLGSVRHIRLLSCVHS